MKLFVAMPFADEFRPVHQAIKEAAHGLGVEAVRVDELAKPGPIVAHIFEEIGAADFVIAEVSSNSPNVFYEVGLAHCVKKPTLLLVSREAVDRLPFDVRHNRVITYDRKNPGALVEAIASNLKYLVERQREGKEPPGMDAFFSSLGGHQRDSKVIINEYVAKIAKEFQLTDAKLIEYKYLSLSEGVVLTVGDAFGERVAVSIDANGIVRRMKKL